MEIVRGLNDQAKELVVSFRPVEPGQVSDHARGLIKDI